jgi:hypothetical protein
MLATGTEWYKRAPVRRVIALPSPMFLFPFAQLHLPHVGKLIWSLSAEANSCCTPDCELPPAQQSPAPPYGTGIHFSRTLSGINFCSTTRVAAPANLTMEKAEDRTETAAILGKRRASGARQRLGAALVDVCVCVCVYVFLIVSMILSKKPRPSLHPSGPNL